MEVKLILRNEPPLAEASRIAELLSLGISEVMGGPEDELVIWGAADPSMLPELRMLPCVESIEWEGNNGMVCHC